MQRSTGKGKGNETLTAKLQRNKPIHNAFLFSSSWPHRYASAFECIARYNVWINDDDNDDAVVAVVWGCWLNNDPPKQAPSHSCIVLDAFGSVCQRDAAVVCVHTSDGMRKRCSYVEYNNIINNVYWRLWWERVVEWPVAFFRVFWKMYDKESYAVNQSASLLNW